MSKKHIHKLRRHKYKTGSITYFCVLDCSFKVNPALAIGKTTICWICDQPFTMNEYSIRLAKPHCPNCHKPKNKELVPKIFNPEPVQAMSNDAPISDDISDLRNRLAIGDDDEGEI